MLQALSYCAQGRVLLIKQTSLLIIQTSGWSIETAIYSRKILALLHEMRHGCEAVLVDNLRMMQCVFLSFKTGCQVHDGAFGTGGLCRAHGIEQLVGFF